MAQQQGPRGSYFPFTLGLCSPQLVQASRKLHRHCWGMSHPFPSLSGIIEGILV